jgi:PAS domain S-box-containing protein
MGEHSSSDRVVLDDAVLRHSLDQSPDGLLICDTDGTIRYANTALCAMTGYLASELVGGPIERLVPANRRAHHATLRRGYGDQPQVRPMGRGLTLTATHADGTEVPVEISLSPIDGPRGTLTIASIRDISERLADAEKLRDTHEALALSGERERIARDLHDTVLQRLFGLGLELQALGVKAGSDVAPRLETAVDEIDRIIKEIRTSVFTLGAAHREGSLGQEIGTILTQSSRVLGFAPRLRIEGPVENMVGAALRPDLTASLREALANVARHSEATEASVEIVLEDNLLSMRIRDNGKGLPDPETRASGNGLLNLQSRALGHRGYCTISSNPDHGVTVEWVVEVD